MEEEEVVMAAWLLEMEHLQSMAEEEEEEETESWMLIWMMTM